MGYVYLFQFGFSTRSMDGSFQFIYCPTSTGEQAGLHHLWSQVTVDLRARLGMGVYVSSTMQLSGLGCRAQAPLEEMVRVIPGFWRLEVL